MDLTKGSKSPRKHEKSQIEKRASSESISSQHQENITKIRIDINCPNEEIYKRQIRDGTNIKTIFVQIDRSLNTKHEQNENPGAILIEEVDDVYSMRQQRSPEYQRRSFSRSKTDPNLMQLQEFENIKEYSLQSYSNYTQLDKPIKKKKYLFNLKRNYEHESYISKKINGNGSAAIEIINYEHEIFEFNNYQATSRTKVNPKISVSIFRDSESISSCRPRLIFTKPQNLKRSELFLFDFNHMEFINETQNRARLLTSLKYPYAKMCDLDMDNLFMNPDKEKPDEFEISLGDFNFQLGTNFDGNTKYESFRHYTPVYIEFDNLDLSNDQILEIINSKVTAKTQELNEKFIANLNKKFPLDFLFFNSSENNINIVEFKDKSIKPEFYLLAYQVLDEKFVPLEADLLKFVKVHYSTFEKLNEKSIKTAVEKVIGQKNETYGCNFFRLWHYIVLIKTPRADLRPIFEDEALMENFDFINDSDFLINSRKVAKITHLSLRAQNVELIENEVKIEKNPIRNFSSGICREEANLKHTKLNQKMTRKKYLITTLDFNGCGENVNSSLDVNQNNNINENVGNLKNESKETEAINQVIQSANDAKVIEQNLQNESEINKNEEHEKIKQETQTKSQADFPNKSELKKDGELESPPRSSKERFKMLKERFESKDSKDTPQKLKPRNSFK
ncbi:unnamed protein product [Brachionus calyciflorus]|uniref:Uncharacterized protein n=1 Tax=Brachionus calyciflorus TaxID=104777 RepID=A0A813SMY1_9BILA|nr:unnamed protein product [Brachionus calyciflorus]